LTPKEAAELVVALATLVSSLAALVVAIRTGQKASATHELVNGASTRQEARIQALGDSLAVAKEDLNEVRLSQGESRGPGADRPPTLRA